MSRYPIRSILLVVLALSASALSGGASCGELEELYVVDSPTAGIVPHGGYIMHGSVGPSSSLLFGVKIGFHDRLMLGASFGLQNFVGRGEIEVNDKPGFEIRLRIIEEEIIGPALAIGIDTQGEDIYLDDLERYERKSKGFYAVISRNYRLIRDFSLHGGGNYSLEREDEEGVNFFAGMTLELIPGFYVLLDYNAAVDDDDADNAEARTKGRGYLDAGVRFDYRENLRIKLNFKDLLDNYIPESGIARSFELFYVNYF
ncbi:MAG TPA: hypothetical protein ENO08_02150 [Candidatus Eisenbacteria bacterium]|uniref:Outer membrane protein beta-barrel domain-containing protein n=1 Tax=Eiseniibacteriota bacterium TaxID=2212470 RepID=A0A7V2AU08_UNCEI|nr:hypothetical protein [Candidatus Eisenbacteria bacterium]